jgi:hypothetical protein
MLGLAGVSLGDIGFRKIIQALETSKSLLVLNVAKNEFSG